MKLLLIEFRKSYQGHTKLIFCSTDFQEKKWGERAKKTKNILK